MAEDSNKKEVSPEILAYRQKRRFVFEQIFMCQFYEPEETSRQLEQLSENRDLLEALEENNLTQEEILDLREKAGRIMACRQELDERIDAVATGWRTGRMGRAELSLIRQALYDILYDDTIPYRVAINEAVELAKLYGSEDAPAFVNAVLGKLVRETGLAADG